MVAGLVLGAASSVQAQPLKVFILAGQSNMQGHVNISTFPSMADDPKTAPILKEMLNGQGKPKVLQNVWIASIGCAGNDTNEQTGRLTAGFGAGRQEIGPEFTFGIYIEKMLGGPILIIKTSWGGKSLNTDFRPPSAGPYVWNHYALEQLKRRHANVAQAKADKIKATGVYYRLMIGYVRKVLANIKRVDPQYNPKQGYELAGFVWFQGWNDMVDSWTYPQRKRPGGYDLYSQLMGMFIDDVRKDLSAPRMPFVIGTLGVGGLKHIGMHMVYFRQAEAAPSLRPQFKGNVAVVQTAPYWDDHLAALQARYQGYWRKVNAKAAAEKNTSWKNRIRLMNENFTPEELKQLKGISAFGFHYLGAAKIIAPIGKAFAEATAKLDKTTQLPVVIGQ
ncbi:MAG: hypothetical protein HKL96_06435 [Phycisphaerales bacterium]|nr:hypothetical protein [Phycisphaerales bacterium]